jgi:hypothetical protein
LNQKKKNNMDTVTQILSLIPGGSVWLKIAIVGIPVLGRLGYAAYHGNGVWGAIKGLIFGTNTPPTKPTDDIKK